MALVDFQCPEVVVFNGFVFSVIVALLGRGFADLFILSYQKTHLLFDWKV